MAPTTVTASNGTYPDIPVAIVDGEPSAAQSTSAAYSILPPVEIGIL